MRSPLLKTSKNQNIVRCLLPGQNLEKMRTQKSRPSTRSCFCSKAICLFDYETELCLQWIPGVRGMEIRSQGPPNVGNIIGEPHINVELKGPLRRSAPPLPSLSESHGKTCFAQDRARQEQENKRNPTPSGCDCMGTLEAQMCSSEFISLPKT